MAVTINGTTGIDTPSLTADTTTLVVDETNNRVGIGTASPTEPLDVISDSGATAVKIRGRSSDNIATMPFTSNDGATTYGQVQGRSTDFRIYTIQNIPIEFYQNDALAAEIDTNKNFQFNSGYGSVATAYGCRAWVNFQGTGTVTIRESGNVSSVADRDAGRYTVNLSSAMPDTNYSGAGSVAGTKGATNEKDRAMVITAYTTSAVYITAFKCSTGAATDNEDNHVIIVR